jgi:tellurite resistance protein
LTSQDIATQSILSTFEDVERIVEDDIRFKLRLGIGSDAYSSMKYGKRLQALWDVGGVAATGAGVASSSTVAGMFFASSGWLSAIGLGAAAATPIGWVLAAAATSGAAYYGVTKLIKGYSDDLVQTVPKFINTPLDILAMGLLDLIAPLAIKVALVDDKFHPDERKKIEDYFVQDWGFSREYVRKSMPIIEENISDASLDAIVRSLVDFKIKNPDCNYTFISKGILQFLREIIETDGVVDMREELALERVQEILNSRGRLSFSRFTSLFRGSNTNQRRPK